jgi:hypothetical protein
LAWSFERVCGQLFTLPLLPLPQKNMSLPFDSSPDTAMPAGMSSYSRTSPGLRIDSAQFALLGFPRRLAFHLGDAGDEAVRARACGNRLRWPTPLPDLRGIAFRRRSLVEFGAGARRKPAPAVRAQSHALRCPTQSIPSTHAIPGAPPSGAGMVASTRPVIGWAAGSIPQMLIERCAR